MFVHAHPDDESSKGAATAARYVDAGARVVLVTCTGGEVGEVLNPSADPVDPAAMPAVRRRELETAVRILGFAACYHLGFVDSGYHEKTSEIPAGTFAAQPLDKPAGALAEVLRTERPHVLVTYPEDGGYPHPDHVMCHTVTVRAVELAEDETAAVAGAAWRVPKVYACHAFPPARVLALHHALTERIGHSPFDGWLERRAERAGRSGRQPAADGPCHARIRVDAWFGRRDDALRAHVTQVDPDGTWFSWPRDVEREVFPWECFTRLRPPWHAGDEQEDDLLAGLDL